MRPRTVLIAACCGLLGACSFPRVVGDLDRESPPQELGRPGYVRYTARTGAWLGGLAGAVGSIVTLPITYPITLLADEPLGYSKDEFLYWGVSVGAATGHFVLGAPVDSLDWVARRAWTDTPDYSDYELTPATPPAHGEDPRAASEPSPATEDQRDG